MSPSLSAWLLGKSVIKGGIHILYLALISNCFSVTWKQKVSGKDRTNRCKVEPNITKIE